MVFDSRLYSSLPLWDMSDNKDETTRTYQIKRFLAYHAYLMNLVLWYIQ